MTIHKKDGKKEPINSTVWNPRVVAYPHNR